MTRGRRRVSPSFANLGVLALDNPPRVDNDANFDVVDVLLVAFSTPYGARKALQGKTIDVRKLERVSWVSEFGREGATGHGRAVASGLVCAKIIECAIRLLARPPRHAAVVAHWLRDLGDEPPELLDTF